MPIFFVSVATESIVVEVNILIYFQCQIVLMSVCVFLCGH
jgi:hypothetical protein